MPRLVPLTPRYAACHLPPRCVLVDDADDDRVVAVRWREQNGLAVADGARPRCTMHRFILGPPPGQLVHHRNRDVLDNRRENLLVCPDRIARSLRRVALRDVLQTGDTHLVWVGPFRWLMSEARLRALAEQLRGAEREAALPRLARPGAERAWEPLIQAPASRTHGTA